MKRVMYSVAAAVAVAALAEVTVRAQAAPVRASALVTTGWVAQHLEDPDLVLLQVGERKDYDAAHLPGARFLPREAIGVRDGASNLTLQLPPVSSLVEALAALGVSDSSRVVLYFGTNWVTPTARAYVTLDYLGLGDRTSIMDGGLPAWQAERRPVTTDVAAPRTGRLTARPRADVMADLAYVQSHQNDPRTIIVDSRTPEFFTGEQAGSMPRSGHIPGARSIPFSSLVTDDNKLKDPIALRALFAGEGVTEGKSVVTYCHIGQQASLGYFVAKYLGFPVRLYDGSFEEWSRHAEVPVATGSSQPVRKGGR
jgi:thiosulfate/3-mercaptopyruvate sulfurtransferase